MTRIAVIGVGTMGSHHARVLSQLPDATLVAVSDTDAARAEQIAATFGCRAYTDVERLLESEPELDAVTISAPTSVHVEIALAAMERGLDVLVEKPLAEDLAGAEFLAAEADRLCRVLAVGHVERFNPGVREVHRRLLVGDFGEVTSIIARRVGLFPPRMTNSNVVIDLAIHDIEVCNHLMGGLPELVQAGGGRIGSGASVDYVEIFLRYGSAACFVQANWITPIKIRKLTVTGTAGYVELDYVTQQIDVYSPVSAPDPNGLPDYDEFQRYAPSRVTFSPTPAQEPLRLELAGFVARVRDGSGEIVTAAEAVEAVRIAEAALAQILG